MTRSLSKRQIEQSRRLHAEMPEFEEELELAQEYEDADDEGGEDDYPERPTSIEPPDQLPAISDWEDEGGASEE